MLGYTTNRAIAMGSMRSRLQTCRNSPVELLHVPSYKLRIWVLVTVWKVGCMPTLRRSGLGHGQPLGEGDILM